MKIHVTKLETFHHSAIKNVYESSTNKTFQHTPEFIAYHGDKFNDFSALITTNDAPIGFCLAAAEPSMTNTVASHPGAAFGGLVVNADIRGGNIVSALEALLRYYSRLGFKEFTYKAIPHIYSNLPSDDLTYATHRNGGVRKTSLLSCALDLRGSYSYSSQRIRGIKTGRKKVDLEIGWGNIEPFWNLLSENLKLKHASKPLHNFLEIGALKAAFSEEIDLIIARDKEIDAITAGVVLFKHPNVWKTQYIASNELGRKSGALDFLFSELALLAKQQQIKYLDFGTSNEDFGAILNEGLYTFKSGFGGGGLAYDQYGFKL